MEKFKEKGFSQLSILFHSRARNNDGKIAITHNNKNAGFMIFSHFSWLSCLLYCSLANVPTFSPTLRFCQYDCKEILNKSVKQEMSFWYKEDTPGLGDIGVLKC